MNRFIKTLVIIGALLWLGTGTMPLQAREVTLTWDANSEPDLSHYIVYYGTVSRVYTVNSGNIGLKTEHKVQLPDDGKVYFFAVTAVDKAGLESDYSNEVNTGEVAGPKLRPDLTPPGKYKFNKDTDATD
jgi:fibronectin type 3 domain-containing protein